MDFYECLFRKANGEWFLWYRYHRNHSDRLSPEGMGHVPPLSYLNAGFQAAGIFLP